MGFLMGSSCFLHSPLSFSPFPSSSCSSSHPIFLCSTSRSAETRRRRTVVPMASLRQEDSNDGVCSMRRAILFVGISVLPLLQLRATALEGLATKESELRTPEGSKNTEEAPQTKAPQTKVSSSFGKEAKKKEENIIESNS